jgi:Putative  PD-(D/E)XK family member, (DUF4420)
MAPRRGDLSRRWAVLGPTSAESYLLTSVIHTASGHELRIGVDRVGTRHLLVPVGAGDTAVPDDVVGALMLKRTTFTFDQITALYLDIQCVRSDLFDLFDEVLAEVIDGADAGGGADAAVEVVDRWRSLLAARGRRQLSTAAQRGLVAELYVLRLAHQGQVIDVDTWRGPLSEPQDISLPECALEVKSVGELGRDIEIHGVFQLAEPGKPLALVLVRLVEDESGETVAQHADYLLDNASDRALAVSRLAMVGYSSADSDTYSTRFKVDDVQFVAIDTATPRIVPQSFRDGMLPFGISYLTYQIELGALSGFIVSGESALRQWITHPLLPPEGVKAR